MPRTERSGSPLWLVLCGIAALTGCATTARQHAPQLCAVAAEPGCTTAAQQQEQRSAATVNEALATFKSCGLAIWAKPEYVSLLSHTPDPETGKATKAQLRDAKRPSPAEAKLLAMAYDDSTQCRTQVLSSLLPARPDIVPIVAETFRQATAATILLGQRKIAWGEAARRGQTRLKDLQWRIAAADRRWVADLNASHQAETTQRQAAAAAMVRYTAQKQVIISINRPAQSSCHGVVNCPSY